MVVLLVGILAVTGVLTHQAQLTARGQQKAVKKILVSHANFAAAYYTEVIRLAVTSLHKMLYYDVVELKSIRLPADYPIASMTGKHTDHCQCDPMQFVEQHLAYDYTTDTFYPTDGPLTPEHEAGLRVLLNTAERADLKDGWKFLLARLPGDESAVHSFAIRMLNDSSAAFAIGFRAKDELLELRLMPVDSFNLRLPHDPQLPNSTNRFAITVSTGDRLLVAGGDQPHGEPAEWKIGAPFGDFTVRAWVNAAQHEEIIGAPIKRARLPLLIGLMAFSVVLTAMALILLKRQSELAQLRSEFVSNVSHELRTPLAQIRMFAETLLLGRVRNDTDRKRSLEIIDQEARRLSALVENVLQLGRSERGTLTLAPAAVELAPAMREVVDSFAQLPRARNVDLRQELEPRLVATVDPGAFRQILLNLLDNAVKYGPAGQRVVVGLAMFEEHARLWVDDEGPGIPKRDRDRVFDPFYRSPEHVASHVAGSGIGLAIVRELAASLGGTAWAEDAPGGGARLIVEFPQAYLRPDEATGGVAVA